jgi:thiol:disulfide interchange protein DsbD
MVTPLLPTWLQILGWAILALFSAVLLRTFEPLGTGAGFSGLLRKTLGMMLTLLCLIWLLGIASGGNSLLQPLSHLARSNAALSPAATATAPASASKNILLGQASEQSSPTAPRAQAALWSSGAHPPFKRVRSIAELETELARSTRPVLLDFYADWCVSCKEMESLTFTKSNVAQRMDQLLLLQADVTANNPEDRALLKRFKLFGPPGIIFFEPGGRERKDVRIVGFQDANRFAANLDRVLSLK